MRFAKELSKKELVELVERIQRMAFCTVQYTLEDVPVTCWAPDKELGADAIGSIVGILDSAGLRPKQEGRAECAACGQSPIKPNELPFCFKCLGKAGV